MRLPRFLKFLRHWIKHVLPTMSSKLPIESRNIDEVVLLIGIENLIEGIANAVVIMQKHDEPKSLLQIAFSDGVGCTA